VDQKVRSTDRRCKQVIEGELAHEERRRRERREGRKKLTLTVPFHLPPIFFPPLSTTDRGKKNKGGEGKRERIFSRILRCMSSYRPPPLIRVGKDYKGVGGKTGTGGRGKRGKKEEETYRPRMHVHISSNSSVDTIDLKGDRNGEGIEKRGKRGGEGKREKGKKSGF